MRCTDKKSGEPPGFHSYALIPHGSSDSARKTRRFCCRNMLTIAEGT